MFESTYITMYDVGSIPLCGSSTPLSIFAHFVSALSFPTFSGESAIWYLSGCTFAPEATRRAVSTNETSVLCGIFALPSNPR